MGSGLSASLSRWREKESVDIDEARSGLGDSFNELEWSKIVDVETGMAPCSAIADLARRREAGEAEETSEAEVFFQHLAAFFQHRKATDALWASKSTGLIESGVEPVDNVDSPESSRSSELGQQRSLNGGGVATTVAEVRAAGAACKPAYDVFLRRISRELNLDDDALYIAPMKTAERTAQKAVYEYAAREPGPGVSWVTDIVRASFYFDDEAELVRLVDHVTKGSHAGVEVLKVTNHFRHPTPAGFRDVNLKLRVEPLIVAAAVCVEEKQPVMHICEIQCHIREMVAFSKARGSHRVYDYFRRFFRGGFEEVEEQCEALRALLDVGVASLPEAVQVLLSQPPPPRKPLPPLDVKEDDESAKRRRTSEVLKSSHSMQAVARLCLSHTADYDLAAALYGRLAELEPRGRRSLNAGVARVEQARALKLLGHLGRACEACDAALPALQSRPELYCEALALKAKCLMLQSKSREAREKLTQGLELMRKLDGLYRGRSGIMRHSAPLLTLRARLLVDPCCRFKAARADLEEAELQIKASMGDTCAALAEIWVVRATLLTAQCESRTQRRRDLFFLEESMEVSDDKEVELAVEDCARALELLHRTLGDATQLGGEAQLVHANALLAKRKRTPAVLEEAVLAVEQSLSKLQRGVAVPGPLVAWAQHTRSRALAGLRRLDGARAARLASREVIFKQDDDSEFASSDAGLALTARLALDEAKALEEEGSLDLACKSAIEALETLKKLSERGCWCRKLELRRLKLEALRRRAGLEASLGHYDRSLDSYQQALSLVAPPDVTVPDADTTDRLPMATFGSSMSLVSVSSMTLSVNSAVSSHRSITEDEEEPSLLDEEEEEEEEEQRCAMCVAAELDYAIAAELISPHFGRPKVALDHLKNATKRLLLLQPTQKSPIFQRVESLVEIAKAMLLTRSKSKRNLSGSSHQKPPINKAASKKKVDSTPKNTARSVLPSLAKSNSRRTVMTRTNSTRTNSS